MDIFSYQDFRLFLRDRVNKLQSENVHLSIREILRQIGCSSPSYYKEVILDAKKRMSVATARRFAAFFLLSSDETEYFLLLVQYNQSKTEFEKIHFHEKILNFRKKTVIENHFLHINEYGYMAEWYHAVIRELLPLLPEFGNRSGEERHTLAKLLRIKLTDHQIDETIKLLERLKFIQRNEQGNFEKTDTAIRVEKKSAAAYPTLCQFMDIGKSIINTTDLSLRLVKMAVLSMNSEIFSIIEHKINEIFQEIIEITGTAKPDIDRLYAINIQLFPLTRLPEEEGRSERERMITP